MSPRWVDERSADLSEQRSEAYEALEKESDNIKEWLRRNPDAIKGGF